MSGLHIIEKLTTKEALKKIAEERFGGFVKAAVDSDGCEKCSVTQF